MRVKATDWSASLLDNDDMQLETSTFVDQAMANVLAASELGSRRS